MAAVVAAAAAASSAAWLSECQGSSVSWGHGSEDSQKNEEAFGSFIPLI